jgi:ribosomal protein S18 acetylase RimI-like enzyme
MLDIQKVTTEGLALESIKSLFKAYLGELNEDLCFQSFDTEIDNPLYKYSAPTGALFIAFYNGVPVGCIALQPLQEPHTCEMKRLYVAPDYRKLGVGDALVKILLQEAQSLGYATMKLDTLERLQAAIQLYQKFGFETVTAYYDNPLPSVVYMEKNYNLPSITSSITRAKCKCSSACTLVASVSVVSVASTVQVA